MLIDPDSRRTHSAPHIELAPSRQQRLARKTLQKRKEIDALEDRERLMALPIWIKFITAAFVMKLGKMKSQAKEPRKLPAIRPN